MPLTITDDSISGEYTTHTARPVPGHPHAWQVSWLPGRLLDRNTAITAMVLADTAASSNLQPGDRLWPHIEGWAAEIGLTAPDALTRMSQPAGRTTAEKDGIGLSDPEAAG
jgi:hypothetical protein